MFETVIKMYSEGVPVSEIAVKVGLLNSLKNYTPLPYPKRS